MLVASVDFIDNDKLLLPLLDLAEGISRQLGVDERRCARLRLAFEEILKERIAKAYEQGGVLTAEIDLTNSHLELSLRDLGRPYWLGEPEYDPSRVSEDAEGLETYLVTKMVDRFGSEKLGKDGQRMFLQLDLPRELELSQSQTDNEDIPPLDTDFTIRRVIDDERDVINVISCLYDEYGYSYGNEGIYYPKTFKEMALAGKYCSYLAVNRHDEIAGHGALSFSDDLANMPELGGLVVKRRFRGQHISRMLFEHRMAEAQAMGLPAVWGEPVAIHSGAQTNFHKGGFTATGFHFNFLNRDMQSPYRRGDERMPIAVCVKLLDRSREERIYMPEPLLPFAGKIYQNLGGKAEFLPPQPPLGESRLRIDVMSRLNLARATVFRAGENFRWEIDSLLRTCYRQHVDVAEALLSLRDPGAGAAYDILRSQGFFFTGLLPGSDSGCYALLQKLIGEEPDFTRPVTIADFSEVLADIEELYGES